MYTSSRFECVGHDKHCTSDKTATAAVLRPYRHPCTFHSGLIVAFSTRSTLCGTQPWSDIIIYSILYFTVARCRPWAYKYGVFMRSVKISSFFRDIIYSNCAGEDDKNGNNNDDHNNNNARVLPMIMTVMTIEINKYGISS